MSSTARTEFTVVTTSAASTRRVAGALARALPRPAVIALHGDLGAGKTTFVQGVVEALAPDAALRVQSPSFALARTYPTSPPVHHLDLYRLDDEAACWDLGLGDLVQRGDGLCCVEWAERAPSLFTGTPLTEVYFPANASRRRRLRFVLASTPDGLEHRLAAAARRAPVEKSA